MTARIIMPNTRPPAYYFLYHSPEFIHFDNLGKARSICTNKSQQGNISGTGSDLQKLRLK